LRRPQIWDSKEHHEILPLSASDLKNEIERHPSCLIHYCEIHKKDPAFNGKELVSLEQDVRSLKQSVEQLRSKKNELAALAKGGITDELREQSKQIGIDLKGKEQELQEKEAAFKALYLACPNIPFAGVPVGGKEENEVVKVVGEKP